MRSAVPILLAAALGVVCAVLVAACGGDDSKLIPQRDAEALKRYADRVGAAVDQADCLTAAAEVQRAQDRIAELPASVDDGLRANLEAGFQNLAQRAARECQGTTETTPTETTQTETTTETTETETTPTETTETDTTTTEEPPPTTDETPPTDTGTDTGGGTEAPSP
jgi:cell division protein FtsN